MERSILWIALSKIKGIGPKTLKRILLKLGKDPDLDDVKKLLGHRRGKALEIALGEAQKVLDLCERESIEVITFSSDRYPKTLLDLEDPPAVLFARGTFRDQRLFGIVGSRKANAYSLGLVDRIVKEGVKRGWGTVSGGAVGIDRKTHEATLKEGGYTVCVLGEGVLKAKGKIFQEIVSEGGLILSEFEPLTPASKYTFPRRNRLIAALSEFLVIPQAGQKSGSLITAEVSFKLKRRIYAHEGPKNSKDWEGCRVLIEKGKATPFSYPEEIFGKPISEDVEIDLKKPKTLDQIVAETGKCPEEIIKLLGKLLAEGKVKQIGAFYVYN